MSFKVKNSDVRDVVMVPVSLFSERKLPVKTVYWLSRLQKELFKLYRLYEDERINLNKDFCKKNKEDEPIMEEGEYQFETPAKKRELLSKVEELGKIEIEISIDRLKIPLKQLEGLITSREMVILDPFIEFLVEEDKKDEPPHPELN